MGVSIVGSPLAIGDAAPDRWTAPVASLAVMTIHERPFGRYLEDFAVGDIYRHWPGKTITEADDHLFCMITMNHHPLHTNAVVRGARDRARQERRGRQPRVLARLGHERARRQRRGDREPRGRDRCTHKLPTFHGDTIYAETKVLDVVASSSKPDRGIVTVETKGLNQRGEEVCFFRRKVMVWKRDAAPPRRRPYDEQDIWS